MTKTGSIFQLALCFPRIETRVQLNRTREMHDTSGQGNKDFPLQ